MGNYKSLLSDSQERLKADLIEQLLMSGRTKMPDGRQLYELSVIELAEEFKRQNGGF